LLSNAVASRVPKYRYDHGLDNGILPRKFKSTVVETKL